MPTYLVGIYATRGDPDCFAALLLSALATWLLKLSCELIGTASQEPFLAVQRCLVNHITPMSTSAKGISID